MLWMCLGKDLDRFNPAEEAALGRLAAAHRLLLMDGNRVVTKSEDGSGACAAFLLELATAARTMQLVKAPRTYRDSFTINYRLLFPDQSRNYRVDVLEASFEQYAMIWVNGDKFEFSQEAIRRAEAMQCTWAELSRLLDSWAQTTVQPQLVPRPGRSEVQNTLVALDLAWATFEERYITELIQIEAKARRFIVQAIEHERCLQVLESRLGQGEVKHQLARYRDEQQRLARCIANLNSVANAVRKGRDDLSVDVLFDAEEAIRRCDTTERGSGEGGEEAALAACILATDVVESFAAMREYLREVKHCVERVDPHLCNNPGLVARLVDWEESWELGARYVQHEELLKGLCSLVAELRAAQRLVPALVTMCEECDVELFLVLPRIMLLAFLAKPKQHVQLLRSLLPHRFIERLDTSDVEEGPASRGLAYTWDAELEGLVAKFRRTRQVLVAGQQKGGASAGGAERAAWEMLIKRVIAGGDGASGGSGPRGRTGSRHQEAVEDLLRELEPWSVEVQRHCPEDWNQCSAILVQCLTQGQDTRRERRRRSEFSV